MSDLLAPFVDKMIRAGMPDAAVRTFSFHLGRYLAGDSGTLGRDRIETVDDIPDVDHIDRNSPSGRAALDRVVVIKLNGGLGTSMGLDRAKSLIEVRDGASFLDLIVRQVQALRRSIGRPVPVLFMNSYRTESETLRVLDRVPHLEGCGIPLSFQQHRVPKILAATSTPAEHPSDPDLEWCPPGHGDLYTALATSGALDRLLDQGITHAFISNADNLGAVLDPGLLGHMVDEGLDLMMEVSDRTPADRKGGHLCRLDNGRLALRESAQCPPDEADEFQDVERYRFFNTNNLWLHLPSVKARLDAHDQVLPLPTIVNRKSLDPRDPQSPAVIQLETAMGAAISLFARTTAVRVSRRRFSPVKTTNDLLAVRSDAFELTEDGRIVLAPSRSSPPNVRLDERFYRLLDDLERRFPEGAPSLVDCDTLAVQGDVTFGADVVARGEVSIHAAGAPAAIPPGTVLSGSLDV